MRLEIRDRATAKKTFIAIRRKRKFLTQPTEVTLARNHRRASAKSEGQPKLLGSHPYAFQAPVVLETHTSALEKVY